MNDLGSAPALQLGIVRGHTIEHHLQSPFHAEPQDFRVKTHDLPARLVEKNPRRKIAEIQVADAYALLAWVLHYSGRSGQALKALGEALQRNPNSSASYHEIAGEIHFAAERYRQAIQEFQATLARNPTHMRARLWLAASHLQLGQQEQAAWEVQEVLNIYPEFSLSRLPRAFPLKDLRQLDTLTQALRQSGLPER